MARITQRELVARYLAARPTQWVPGHELVKNLKSGIIVQDADTRAYELVRDGFESDKYRYEFEHKKQGKYAYFKMKSRTEKKTTQDLIKASIEWFDALPA